METAEQKLQARDARNALPAEQQALASLQRAEEAYRDVRVRMEQQQGGGGGGGQGSSGAADELADLFQLEMDKLRNQYETFQRSQQQAGDNKVDEMLERLKELARRQEQEAERQRQSGGARQQAAAAPRAPGSGSWPMTPKRPRASSSGCLARKAVRIWRRRPARLRQAAEAMRRAAASGDASAFAQAREAAERLGQARDRLDQQRFGSDGAEHRRRQCRESGGWRAHRMRSHRTCARLETAGRRPPRAGAAALRPKGRPGGRSGGHRTPARSDGVRLQARAAAGVTQGPGDGRRHSRQQAQGEDPVLEGPGAERAARDGCRVRSADCGGHQGGRGAAPGGGGGRRRRRTRRPRRGARAGHAAWCEVSNRMAQRQQGGRRGGGSAKARVSSRRRAQARPGQPGRTGGDSAGGRRRTGGSIRASSSASRANGAPKPRRCAAICRRMGDRRRGTRRADCPYACHGGRPAGQRIRKRPPGCRSQLVEGFRRFEFDLRRLLGAQAADQLFLSGSDDAPAGYRKAIENYYRALAREKK